jgi:hypothetical protein
MMAPKETKKDRERRLKKAEELTTDAQTDGPTDDDEPDNLLYDAEGGLIKPGISAAAAAAAAVAQSSTYREMSAVLKTLLCCQKQLQMTSPTTLWWLTDRENVARIF